MDDAETGGCWSRTNPTVFQLLLSHHYQWTHARAVTADAADGGRLSSWADVKYVEVVMSGVAGFLDC